VLSQQVLNHAAFARPEADPATVRDGARHLMSRLQRRQLTQQINEAERTLVAEMTDEAWARLQPLLEEKGDEDGTTGGGAR